MEIKKFSFIKYIYCILTILFFYFCGSNSEISRNPSLDSNPIIVEDSIYPIETVWRGLEKEKIIIAKDYVFGANKEYWGFSTKIIFKDWLKKYNLDSNSAEIEFICLDGYIASSLLNKLLNYPGYLVVASANDSLFKSSDFAKYLPAYLTWDLKSNFKDFVYPYQIKSFKLLNNRSMYDSIKPKNDASIEVKKGYKLLIKNCITCHSINNIGGAVGVELNYPNNVLDYWQKDKLKEYILNPQEFRPNSKMEKIDGIKSEDVDLIFSYLKYINK